MDLATNNPTNKLNLIIEFSRAAFFNVIRVFKTLHEVQQVLIFLIR